MSKKRSGHMLHCWAGLRIGIYAFERHPYYRNYIFKNSTAGGERRASNISPSIILCADEGGKVISSFGCFPIIVSSATTPKL